MYRRRYASRRKGLRRLKRRAAFRGVKRRGSALVSGAPKRRRTMKKAASKMGLVGSIRTLVPMKKIVMHTYQWSGDPIKYGSSGNLSPSTLYIVQQDAGGFAGSAIFVCNGLYDPNNAILGLFNQSAMLYDYMANIYNRYEVISCKAVFTFRQGTLDTPDYDIGCGVRLDDTGGSLFNSGITFQASRNDPRNKTGILKCDYNRGGQCTITHYWSKFQVTRGREADIDSAVGSNPTVKFYFIPYISQLGPTITNGSSKITVSANFYYKVRWIEPKDIAGSTAINMAQGD